MSTAYPPMACPPRPAAHQQPYESGLPVQPTRYHGLWRSPRWRVWRPIVGALVGGVLWFVALSVFSTIGVGIDLAGGRYGSFQEYLREAATGGGLTPAIFIANNLALACSIPIVWLVARLHSQPIGFVHSVTGRFRWRWFGHCLLVLLPVWVVFIAVETLLAGGFDGLAVTADTPVLILGVLLTTPIQCAGEEWFFRGGINRLVASCFPQRTRTLGIVSALVGGAVSSLCFMRAHSAQDPWLNITYFGFAVVACLMCYRTGGLEASTAMHILNNMTSMVFVPFSDISRMFDRSEGTGSPASLLQLVVLAIAAALTCWRARARGLATTSEPEPVPAPLPPAGHWQRTCYAPGPVPVGGDPAAPGPHGVPMPYRQPVPYQPWGGSPASAQDAVAPGAEPGDDVLASWQPPVGRPRIMDGDGEPPAAERPVPRQEE
ncbi:type II CAAX prenyl endopeptidase Rce1 family protein [uncultured Propionibacterium sp.]|uniref:CPBP family intramembrane glutamic endopeptidase n=1 Tax=uncultured Propionibacterium sp. TaxID=218066 RepID=UPI0029306A8F|nr:CPBP family glutamic-type intramembrane protease [uncultured Propionibacterium sp.]